MADKPSRPDDSLLALRTSIRAQRRALSDREQRTAADRVRNLLNRFGAVARAKRVAAYFAIDGELDLSKWIGTAQSSGKRMFAPVLMQHSILFAPLEKNAKLRTNRFGIPEPEHRSFIDPRRLDIVLTPIVAFDARGTRLGMGGGFYDRCFSSLGRRSHWSKPKLIGVGYEFQRVPAIERRAWDVPLWAAVTEQGIYRF